MKKRNLIFPFVISSSLFIPSIESVTIDDSLENENNFFEAHEIPIAEGGGGRKDFAQSGGGETTLENIKSIFNKVTKEI